jgi:hypothetical protein
MNETLTETDRKQENEREFYSLLFEAMDEQFAPITPQPTEPQYEPHNNPTID